MHRIPATTEPRPTSILRSRELARPARALVGAVVAVLLGAIPGAAADVTVQARNYRYQAGEGGSVVTIRAGDRVTWVASGEPHTVTSGSPGAVDSRFVDHPVSAGLLNAGDSFTTTFPGAGTFPYFCEIHPEQMTGVVIVLAAATPAPTVTATPAPTPAPTATPAATPRATPAATPRTTPAGTATPAPTASPGPPGTPTPTTAPVAATPTAGAATPPTAQSAAPPTISPGPSASPDAEPARPEPAGSSVSTAAIAIALGAVLLVGLLGISRMRRR